MTRECAYLSVALLISCLLAAPPANGQQEAVADQARVQAARKAHTEQALALLKRSSDYLSGKQAFSFSFDGAFDVRQPYGHVLEFGAQRVVTVRRPDRLRVEERRRDGQDSVFYFDGREMSVHFPSEQAYTTIEKPGSVEQLLDFVIQELDARAPLSELIRRDFHAHIVDQIKHGMVVGISRIAGRRCDHLAFESAGADFQVWLERGDRPVPWRVVIHYKQAEGRPQYRAQFLSWDLDPYAADSVFQFSPPEGSERLSVEQVASDRETKQGGGE